jgi:hypothetical protein
MSWTDESIATLQRMWLEGYSASQISEELGDISRNAVIGKAHRLGLGARSLVMPKLLTDVGDLPLAKRTKRILHHDHIMFVGDLVQQTEAEFLRIPGFGRQSLDDVNRALAGLDLRLGMSLVDWPPDNIEDASIHWEAARRASELQQTLGGATFHPAEDHFAMSIEGNADDLDTASKPMIQQMQSALLQKARSFAEVAQRLDNQPGWSGIGRTANSLADLLNRAPSDIPAVLGYLYPATMELGSFIEMDQQLASSSNSFASPLDLEVRRPLSDLVRNLAPWLRAFPSIREADDEASRFLVQAAELDPTFRVVSAAGSHLLLAETDLEVFRQLRDAAQRGAFQGEKAGGRAKRSASNLVIGVAAFLGSFYSGAIASDVATTSPLVHKAGQFLVDAEKSVTALISDLPDDLRYSIVEFMRDFPNQPPPKSQPPRMINMTQSPTGRKKRHDNLTQ